MHKADFPSETVTHSPDETQALGRRLGASLLEALSQCPARRFCLALCGGLGAGKTCLTQGIAAAFGIAEVVRSPTYTIIDEYAFVAGGKERIFAHIDAYRLRGMADFEAAGGLECLDNAAVAVIEWSDRICDRLSGLAEVLTGDSVVVDILITLDDDGSRRFTIKEKNDECFVY